MGFLGRLFGKKRNGTDDLDDGIDAMLGDQSQPRHHFYTFAHRALRAMAMHNPLLVISALGSEKSDEFLRSVWDMVNEEAKELNEPMLPYPGGIRVHARRVGEFPVAVVEMPEPQGVTECHMVAIVLKLDPKQAEGVDPESVEIDYLTLELGMSIDGTPRTALCGWSKDGAHFNMGDGPPPELDAFLQKVSEIAA